MDTVADLILRLNRMIDYNAAYFRRLDGYMHARQPLAMLPEKIRQDCGDRLPLLRINFARMVVSAIEERLDVSGFTLPEQTSASNDLWAIWQRNNLDEYSQLAHLEALVHGRSYVSVWADHDGYPRIKVESGRQMVVWQMPGSPHRVAALKRWIEPDGHARATLFEPHRITKWQSPNKISLDPYLTESQLLTSFSGFDPYAMWDWSQLPASGWELREPPIPNPLGVVPVIPLNNRPRLLNWGESELTDVIPILDAVNKLATDMLISSEYFATPRRWVTGIEIQTDDDGNPVDPFAKTKGRNWLAESEQTTFGQFPEASLSNFTNAILALTGQLGAVAGLPPHYLGISREPGSADAIRSSEAPLVTKARRKQRHFGGAWEQAMRLAMIIKDGYVRPGLDQMECVWADPETRTIAQQADAATKLHDIGIPLEQLAADLNYSPQEIARLENAQQAAQSPLNAVEHNQQAKDDWATSREIRRSNEGGR